MVLTREIDLIIESAGLNIRDTGSGYVLGAKQDPNALFAAAPLRILALYSIAAMLGAEVSINVLDAANANAHGISRLAPEKVFAAVDGILLSQHPETLAPLIASGGLEAFGIKEIRGCLSTLNDVPARQVTRWWALAHICKAKCNTICKTLNTPPTLTTGLTVYEKLWHTSPPKATRDLKLLLAPLPRFDFGAAADTFAVFDSRWQGGGALYAQLEASGEPYRMKQLAVTAPELLQIGIPRRKIAGVMPKLLTAVCKAPTVNTYPALCALAKTLTRSSLCL